MSACGVDLCVDAWSGPTAARRTDSETPGAGTRGSHSLRIPSGPVCDAAVCGRTGMDSYR